MGYSLVGVAQGNHKELNRNETAVFDSRNNLLPLAGKQGGIMRVLVLCLVASGPAMAQNVPDPSYFVGRYEVIGRDAAGPVEDVLRLTMQDDALAVQSCGGGTGSMVLDRSGEGQFATLSLGDQQLECQWFNTWDNYPLLACYDDGKARLTLWPANEVDGCEGE
jgi:hypothetical protein